MSPAFLQLIEQQRVKQPGNPAVQCGDEVYSYQQLWDEVSHLRQILQSWPIRRVAVALSNCPAKLTLSIIANIMLYLYRSIENKRFMAVYAEILEGY